MGNRPRPRNRAGSIEGRLAEGADVHKKLRKDCFESTHRSRVAGELVVIVDALCSRIEISRSLHRSCLALPSDVAIAKIHVQGCDC